MPEITSSSDRGTRPGIGAVVAAATLLVALTVPVLLAPQEFLRDDSYFYLQIATNIAVGNGSTFHGITPTNGYHPLWMLGAVVTALLAGGDRGAALLLLVVLQLLLAIGIVVLMLKLARAMRLEYGVVGVAVVLVYLFSTGVFGSEAHLNALTLVGGMLSLWHALDDDRAAAWFRTGLLFGLAILARLDNIFVVAALCTLGVLHNPGAGAVARRVMAGALGGALVLAPYLAYNLITYGHMTPISGVIKNTFPAFSFDVHRLGPVGKLFVPFGIVALAAGLLVEREARRRVIWCGLGGGVLAHALYVTGFTDHYTFWPWYYVSAVLAAGLVAAWIPAWIGCSILPDRLRPDLRPLVYSLTLLALVAGTGRAWLKAFGPLRIEPLDVEIRVNHYHWPEEFALWMKDNLPEGSRVFTLDWPGAFAWYSGLPMLPMDGLVNDFAYNDELLARGVEDYLCTHDVEYYLGLHETEGTVEHVSVAAPLYRKSAGVLSLPEEDLVVKVRDVVRNPDEALPFALWRLACPDGQGAQPADLAHGEPWRR